MEAPSSRGAVVASSHCHSKSRSRQHNSPARGPKANASRLTLSSAGRLWSNQRMSTEAAADRSFERGALLRLSGPLIISFWMRSAFGFVDTIYASALGDEAIAAIGLSVPFEFLFIAVWVGLSNGLTATLGEAFGARNGTRILALLQAAKMQTWVTVPLFVGLGLGIYFYAPHMGLAPELTRYFAVYTSVLVAGTGLTGFWSVIPDSLVKAHYNTHATMMAGVISNVVNLVLNTFFLFVLHWGVFGIALSTVLGRLGGLLYALRKAAQLEAQRKRSWAEQGQADTPDEPSGDRQKPGWAIMALAIPASLTFGLMATESGIVNRILAGCQEATEGIAAFAIYHRMALFVSMPMIAISAAALPYFARAFGARHRQAIRRGLGEGVGASMVYLGLVVLPLSHFAAGPIARALADAPATIEFATIALRVVPLAALAALPFVLCRPVFDGMQRGMPGAVMACIRYLGLTFPAAYGGARLAQNLGYNGFYGVVGGLVVAGLLVSIGFLAYTWREMRRLDYGVDQASGTLPSAR